MVELVWTRETEGAALDSPERRAALDARLRAQLARIADPGLRAHWEREIRSRRAALFAPPPRPERASRAPGRARAAAALLAPAPATRVSLLGRPASGQPPEARIRESAILMGCLNHPAVALAVEDRLERLSFRCRDLEEIRDALLSALAGCLDQPDPAAAVAAAVSLRLGRNPLPDLAALGQLRANPHLGPAADPEQAVRAIEEELTRHAALAGMAAEVRDAEVELAGEADEGLTWRLRAAAEASESAVSRALAAGGEAEAEAEAALSAGLQALIDREIWKKPRKR